MIAEFQGEYRFLSNFWPASVMLDGEEYPSVEHAYQAAKFDLGSTPRSKIMAASAGQAKRIGKRGIRPRNSEAIMLDLLRQKFKHPKLCAKLLATGQEPLQEGNRWGDAFWGVNLNTGEGENRLGRLLMQVRAEIGQAAQG